MASPIVRKYVVAGSAEAPGRGLFAMTHAFALSSASGWMSVETLTLGQSDVSLSKVISTGHCIDLTETERLSVILPLNGRIEVDAAENRHVANPGEALVFGPNSRRTWVSTDNNRPYEALVLLAPAWMCRPSGEDRLRDQVIRSDLPQLGSLTRHLGGMLNQAQGCYFRGSGNLPDSARTERVLRLLRDMLGAAGDSVNDTQGDFSWESRLALDFIHTCFANPLSLTDIAQAAGASPRMLQIKVQRDFGLTPIDLLRQVRLAAARRRLKERGQTASVTQIAFECGFSHLGRFAIAYRQTYGEPPSKTVRANVLPNGR